MYAFREIERTFPLAQEDPLGSGRSRGTAYLMSPINRGYLLPRIVLTAMRPELMANAEAVPSPIFRS